MDKAKDLGAPAARTPADVLRVARAKIAQGWCRFADAINRDGHDRTPDAVDAVSWCSNGAIWSAEPGEESDAYNRRKAAREFVLRAISRPNLSEWNDEVVESKAEVLAAFDKAIALAEAAK